MKKISVEEFEEIRLTYQEHFATMTGCLIDEFEEIFSRSTLGTFLARSLASIVSKTTLKVLSNVERQIVAGKSE